MSLNLENASQIREKYNLSGDQYERLMTDVGKLSPQRQAAVTEAYVLAWKAFDESGGDATLPVLRASDLGSVLELAGWTANTAYSSPGATMAALITELAAEQRKDNRNQYMAEADNIANSMKDQASDIREKADKQWTMAWISGAINIASGAVSVVGSSISLGKLASTQSQLSTVMKGDNAKISQIADKLQVSPGEVKNVLQAKMEYFSIMLPSFNAIFQGVSSMGQGAASIVAARGQHQGLMFDAEIKEKDADIEQRRAVMESLRSLDQSLTELIQKSLSTSEAIQQGLNQARSRILG